MSTNNRESSTPKPLVSFDPAGTAPILSYNVPEPTAYAGRSYIELDLDTDLFRSKTKAGTSYHEWISDYILQPAVEQLHEAEAEAAEEVAEEELAVIEERVSSGEGAVADVHETVGGSTGPRTEIETLTDTVETMFQRGDSGPVVGATDERLTESLAAVGNATTLVTQPELAGDSSLATGVGTESDNGALESNLFAAEPLSHSGSGAEVASATLAQTAVENDMDVRPSLDPAVDDGEGDARRPSAGRPLHDGRTADGQLRGRTSSHQTETHAFLLCAEPTQTPPPHPPLRARSRGCCARSHDLYPNISGGRKIPI